MLVSLPVVLISVLGAAEAHEERAPVVLRDDTALHETVELARSYPMTARFGGGSAVLIERDWLLTAAHVARGVPSGLSVKIGGVKHRIGGVVLHPKGLSEAPGMSPEADLALVRLVQPCDSVTPARVNTHATEVGREVVIAGFGDYANAQSAPSPSDGQCRAVTNRIDEVVGHYLACTFDEPDADSVSMYEGVSAPGDSGGPLFISTPEGPLVAGISSFSRGDPFSYNSVDHFTRVSDFHEWIEATIREAPEEVTLPKRVDHEGSERIASDARAFIHAFNEGGDTLSDFLDTHGGDTLRANRERWFEFLTHRREVYGELTLHMLIADTNRVTAHVALADRDEGRYFTFYQGDTGLRYIALAMAPPPR